jgi:PHP family Zn ribbon phosphoesterase
VIELTRSKKRAFRKGMLNKALDPKKYGMVSCYECNGNGKLLNDPENMEVCPRCGGFGFIKKEEDPDKIKGQKVRIDEC